MDNELYRYAAVEAQYVLHGDLSGLTDDEIAYLYKKICQDRGWDWLTRPFELMGVEDTDDDGNPITRKELYPTRQAAALLARDHGYSVEDKGEVWDWENGIYLARARAIDPATGRYWDDEGSMAICREEGGKYVRMWPSKVAIAVRIAKTQARRRAILGLSALARPDAESEMSGVARARALPLPDMARREYDEGDALRTAQETPKDTPRSSMTQNTRTPRSGLSGGNDDTRARVKALTIALHNDGYNVAPMRGNDIDKYLYQLEAIAKSRKVVVDTGGGGDDGEYTSF